MGGVMQEEFELQSLLSMISKIFLCREEVDGHI